MLREKKSYYEYDSSRLPEIRLADTAAIEPPYIHKRRTPHEYIIYLVRHGEMYLSEDETLYHLVPGDFLILDPEKTHVGRKATQCEYYYIHFQYGGMRPVEQTEDVMRERLMEQRALALRSDACSLPGSAAEGSSLLYLPKYAHLAADAGYYEMTQRLNEGIAFHNNHVEGYKALCACRILEILIAVSRQYLSGEIQRQDSGVRSYRKVYDLLNYLNTCYHEPICGDSIEESFGCNFDYLNRIFRQSVGKTIFQYLGEVRIAHAKELITNSSMKISQISERVGFADESYFSKVFKRRTGVAPVQYGKTVRKI